MAANVASLQYRGLTIRFEQGDLTQRTDDAVAISCDMALSSALCLAFYRLSGPQLQLDATQQFQNNAQFHNNQPTAVCVPTNGSLQMRNVVFVPINASFANVFVDVFREMFQAAIQANVQTLSFPPLGTGGFRLLGHYECSQAIFDALKSLTNFGSLTTLSIVNTSAFWVQEYYQDFTDIINLDQQQQPQANVHAVNQQVVSGNAVAASMPTSSNVPFNNAFRALKVNEVRVLREKFLKEKQDRQRLSGGSSNADEDSQENQLDPCPICLSELFDDIAKYDENSDLTIVQTNSCMHNFHRSCLVQWFQNKTICPLCTTICVEITGNQPLNGVMQWKAHRGDLEGFSGAGHIRIDYSFPDGIQTDEHPNPGAYYTGTVRTCYLPNNAEGRLVKDLLDLAFRRRLVFTVGDSLTSGRKNTVIWNGIHHKTNKNGGPSRYGYPDAGYLDRVKDELNAYGINERLLNQG